MPPAHHVVAPSAALHPWRSLADRPSRPRPTRAERAPKRGRARCRAAPALQRRALPLARAMSSRACPRRVPPPRRARAGASASRVGDASKLARACDARRGRGGEAANRSFQSTRRRAPARARHPRARDAPRAHLKRRRALGQPVAAESPQEQNSLSPRNWLVSRGMSRETCLARQIENHKTHTLNTKESRPFASPSSSSLDDSDSARTLSAPLSHSFALASPTRALPSLARSYSRTRARASTLFLHLHARRTGRARRPRHPAGSARALLPSTRTTPPLGARRRRRFRNFYSDSD